MTTFADSALLLLIIKETKNFRSLTSCTVSSSALVFYLFMTVTVVEISV